MLTAYHKHLLNISDFDRTLLANYILAHAMQQNCQAFQLLERTGDDGYSQKTFFKAADWLLRQAKIEKYEPITI